MNSLGSRIAHARKRRDLTQTSLAEALSAAQSTIASWERGANEPSLSQILRIAELTGVSAAVLAFGGDLEAAGPIVHDHTLTFAGEDYALVPVYDANASAGPGCINGDQEPIHSHFYRAQWLRQVTSSSPDQLAVIRVHGDSMWDTLHHGDHVLIDRSVSRVRSDGIYVIQFAGDGDDEIMVKRCSRDPASRNLTIISDNPRYPARDGVSDASLRVIGRVIWLGRNIGG